MKSLENPSSSQRPQCRRCASNLRCMKRTGITFSTLEADKNRRDSISEGVVDPLRQLACGSLKDVRIDCRGRLAAREG